MKKHGIPVLISLLFIVSVVSPLVIGFEADAIRGITGEEEPESTVASGGPMDSPWPMQCYDLHHTSRSPYSTAHIDGLEKWRFRTRYGYGGGVDSGPIIDNNRIIFFGSKDSYVYALYPNGTLNWKYETGGWITSAPVLAEDGTLYVGSWDCKLYAFNSTTGNLKWKVGAHGGSIISSPAIGEDGIIYLGTAKGMGDGEIIAVNPNGTIKWIYPTGAYIYSDPAIGDDGTIYIGSDSNYLYALNPNGTLKWKFKTGGCVKAPPSIADDGTIYIGSYDDYLYAIYLNGTMKWKWKGGGTGANPAIAEDGTIYVGSDKLYAINPNGTIRWKFVLKGRIDSSSSCISADGMIYVGTDKGGASGGDIIAVNPNGTERWRKRIADEWVESSPCIAEDGTVYIGSQCEGHGYIHAFGPVESNSPPEKPTITGKTNGKVGEAYEYKLSVVDPDNNPISFYIDWGDGKEGWKFERASGENCYYSHTWTKRGNYTIRVKARDTLGEDSNWTTLKVTMPKNKNVYLGWVERFPFVQRILDGLRLNSR